jgi:hypothetical protein
MRRNVDALAGLQSKHIFLLRHELNVPVATYVVALELSLPIFRRTELTDVHLLDSADLEQEVVFRIKVDWRDRGGRGDEYEGFPATHTALTIPQQIGDWIQYLVQQVVVLAVVLDVPEHDPSVAVLDTAYEIARPLHSPSRIPPTRQNEIMVGPLSFDSVSRHSVGQLP